MNTFNKFQTKFGHLLDPFVILAIFVVFLVPVITVLNLTPQNKVQTQENPQVLGATNQTKVTIEPNLKYGDGITVDKVTPNGDSSFVLYVNQVPHKSGKYTNELFVASNPTDSEKTVRIDGVFNGVADDTKVSVILDGVKHVILGEDGVSYPTALYLEPGQNVKISVVIENTENVNFSTKFAISLNIK